MKKRSSTITKTQNEFVNTPAPGIPFSHVMLASHHSPPISVQTHGSIVAPAVIQTPSGDDSKNEPRNTSIGASASGHINTAHSPRPGKTPGRKRKPGPDIQMEASKRSPPVQDREESRESGPNMLPPLPPSLLVNAKSQVSKQVLEEFMPPDEGKEKTKMESLHEGFVYDPYLPMSKELQLLSFENRQLARQKKFKYQQQQQMAIELLRKEEHSARMKATKPRSRKQQKSSEISNPSHSPRPGKTPGRKRKPGPDIQMEASKQSPPVRDREESRESGPNMLPPLPPSLLVNAKSQVSKQVLEEFMPPDEGKEKTKMESLHEGFVYDPYLPMSKELQLLSFENRQLARQKKFKYQQQQQMAIELLRKEEQSARMKKCAEPLSVLKTDSTKIPREEQGMKQPETPTLAPMTLGDFKLKIQPITPGIDVPPYHHHQHLSQKQPKDSSSSTGFPVLQPANYTHASTPPPSTRPRDDYYLSICEQVMRESGAMDQTIMHCIFVGPAGVGKSSLLKRLLRMKLDPKRISTQIAEKSVQVEVIRDVSITTAQVSGLDWQKIEDLDSQASGLIGQLSTKHEQAMKKVSPKPATSESLDSEPLERSQFSKTIDYFRKVLKEKGVSGLRQHVNPWTLYLTDSGGQPEFQELLPALVVGPCVFFVVVPLDKDLRRKYIVEYLRPDEQKCQYPSSLTVQEDLLRSLASIASTKYKDKDGNDVKPRIMLVATFKDKVPREEDRQRRLKELQDVVKGTDAFRQHMIVEASETQMVFTINNASDEESEKDAKEIRNAFCILADEFKVHVPSPWLIFSILIQHIYAKETFISKKQCFEVAQECGIHTETECEAALQFLYKQTGVLRYYKEPSELSQIVIKDPQHLFSRVNQLVEKTFIFQETRSRQCTDNFKRGIFSRVDYDKLTKESTSSSKLTPSMLLKLLEHLNVVVPLGGGEKYFMPCAIAHLDEATGVSQMQSATIPPLLITFKCGYCPKGLFGALVTCIANKQVANCTLDLDESQIHRNQICFTMGLYRLLLRITPTYIYIEIIPDSANVSLSPELCTLCNSVRTLIEVNITEACKTLRYSDSANYSLSFVCHCDQRGQLHPAHLRNDPVKRHIFLCSQSKKNVPVNPECHVWLPEPTILLHPERQSVVAGTRSVFRVTATGDKLRFQWQKDRNDLCDGGRYCDTKTDTLHIVDVEEGDKGRYRCIVKNDTERKPSEEALLTIIKSLPTPGALPGMLQPSGAGIILSGQDLHILTEIMRQAVTQWRTIGGSLGIPDSDLNIIQHTPPLIPEGPLGYFREMLSQWLKWAPPNHPWPTIEALTAALQSSGNESLAAKLKPMFLQRKGVSGRPGGPAYNQPTMYAAPHQTPKQPHEQMQKQEQSHQQPLALALASTSYSQPQQPGQLGASMLQRNGGVTTPQQIQPTVMQQIPPKTHTHQDRPPFYPQPTMPWTQLPYFWMPQTRLPFADPTQWWHPLQQAHSMYQPMQLQPQQLAPPPEPTTSQTSLPSGSTTPAMVSLQFQPDPATSYPVSSTSSTPGNRAKSLADVSGRPGGPAYNQPTMYAVPHQTPKQPCEQMQTQEQSHQQPLALASTTYPQPQQPGQLGMLQQNVGMTTPQQMQPKVQQQIPPETHTHQDRLQFYPQPAMPWTQPPYFWMPQTRLPFADPTQWWHPLQQAHSMYQPMQLQPQQLAPPPEPTTSQT